MREYMGYELRWFETKGNGINYCEVWKDGTMWGFASSEVDAEIMVDRMIEKEVR